MKIAIDARWIFREMSGIGVYTRELIRQFAAFDRENEYTIIHDNDPIMHRIAAEAILSDKPNFCQKLVPYGVFSVENQVLMPRMIAKEQFDVFHSPNYMIPLMAFPAHRHSGTKCVVTIHDVIPLMFPGHAPKSKKSKLFPIYQYIMRSVGKRANAIITVSQASRRDVINHLRIPAERQAQVRTVYNGVSERFSPAGRVPKSTDPNRPRTVLYVGRSDPYKNLPLLIRAFAKARTRCPFPLNLVIAGTNDPRYPESMELVAGLGLEADVRWTGYLSDIDLASEYLRADLLAHPSLYEGFGLQIAEAMACGLPVVCTDAGSLPEIAGESAMMVKANDPAAFSQAMVRVLTDETLAASLAANGPLQAAKFTWLSAAKQTLAAYRSVVD